VLDTEGRFLRVNPAWEKLLGYTSRDLAGKGFLRLVHPEDLQLIRTAAAELRGQGAVFQCENRLRARDGAYHWIEWRAYLDGSGLIHAAGRNINERKRVEAGLAEEAVWRRMLIDQSRDGIVVIDTGTHSVYKANQAFADMLGYTLEEAHRLHLWDFDAQWTHEQLVDMQPRLLSSPAVTMQTRHRRKDGSCYDAEVGFSVAQLGSRGLVFCVVRDISDRKAAEKALQESEEKFSKSFQASPDAIYIVDPDGRTLEVNEGFERFTGYRREEVVGRPFRNLGLWMDPGAREEYTRLFLAQGFVRRHLVRFRHRQGNVIWGEISADPIEIKGQRYALITTRDVTERIQAEEQRRQLEAQVHQAQKLESVGILASGMAHDMNNVLGAILGLASAHLEHPPEDASLRQALETITNACLRGRGLVRGLLSFARPDLAEQRLVDLNTIVADEVRLLERTTLQRIRLETELDPCLAPVMGDAGALSHALMNLCINAVDAMPGGGVLFLRTRNLPPQPANNGRVGDPVGSGQVELTVADNGSGMAPEVMEKALDPFFSTKPQGKGTGLGLFLAYSTVKAHGGQLELDSTLGRGTQVLIRLPASQMPAPAPEPRAASAPAPARSLRILVVDDDDLVRNALRDQLECLGHSPTVASGGREALRGLELGWEIDAVVLDMNMPDLGGAETLRRLRCLRPQVPVLLATGRVDEHTHQLTHEFGAVKIMAKPFSLRELRTQLQNIASQ
jgi:PAS domain S-box-containing protein